MRITKKTILAMGLIASSLTLNSCDYNDNNKVLPHKSPSTQTRLWTILTDSLSMLRRRL